MKKILEFSFLFITLLFLSASFTKYYSQSDTLKNYELQIPLEIFEFELNHIDFFNNVNKLNFYSPFINDSSSLWLRTRLQLNSFSAISSNSPSFNILNPLYEKYLDTQNLRVIKSILGSVSLGATAYLAYKHIKKYGFLKKK